MLIVEICVGSSCHIHGSAFVINAIKDMITSNKLNDKMELKASFCMEECLNGVCIKVDGKKVLNINAENAVEMFKKEILPKAL